MTRQRILVAGIGNIFLGDDGFGVEVARRLIERPLPEGVRVIDAGIRGLDLAYTLLDGYEAAILVDAIQRGGEPGTLYLIEPDPAELDATDEPLVETHGMHPLKVLRLVTMLGGAPGRVLVLGCEPQTLASEEEWQLGLSAPVRTAVAEAAAMVESLVAEMLGAGRTEHDAVRR